MRSVAAMFGGFLVAFGVLFGFALFNGGFVYRTECPRAGGSTETSWTYGINDLIPYTRQTSPPCTSHTATRLALDWIGIADLESSSATAGSKDVAGAERLAAVVSGMNEEWSRQARLSAAFTVTLGGDAPSAAEVSRIRDLLSSGVAEWERLQKDLESTGEASDIRLNDAKRLLARYLKFQIGSTKIYLSGYRDADARIKRSFSDVPNLVAELSATAAELEAAYPQLKDWDFLRGTS